MHLFGMHYTGAHPIIQVRQNEIHNCVHLFHVALRVISLPFSSMYMCISPSFIYVYVHFPLVHIPLMGTADAEI